jgi:hypothetical protein
MEEQLEFDFGEEYRMIQGNQNFEGVGTITVANTGPVTMPTGQTRFKQHHITDPHTLNKEIVLLLQVQFPEVYSQIMDALRAKDALEGKHTW